MSIGRRKPISAMRSEPLVTNAPLHPDFARLYEWLEGDGWDALIAAWEDEECALKLNYFAQYNFSDTELRAIEEFGPSVGFFDKLHGVPIATAKRNKNGH